MTRLFLSAVGLLAISTPTPSPAVPIPLSIPAHEPVSLSDLDRFVWTADECAERLEHYRLSIPSLVFPEDIEAARRCNEAWALLERAKRPLWGWDRRRYLERLREQIGANLYERGIMPMCCLDRHWR